MSRPPSNGHPFGASSSSVPPPSVPISSSPPKRPTTFSFANMGITSEQALSMWESLRLGIDEIHRGNSSQLRFTDLVDVAYKLVLHKYGELLYNGVSDVITMKLQMAAIEVASSPNSTLLEVLSEAFAHHKRVMEMMSGADGGFLMHLDKMFAAPYKLVGVYEMGLYLFRDHVLFYKDTHSRMKAILLGQIQREREGEVIDRSLIRRCLTMLVECNGGNIPRSSTTLAHLEVYVKEFEKDFLVQTRQFYQTESQSFISQNTCPEYLMKAEGRIKEEEARAEAFLDRSTRPKLRQVVIEELMLKYSKQLVEDEKTGAIDMFNSGKVEDLHRMYQLFSLSVKDPRPLECLRDCMSTLIRKIGVNIVQDKENLKNPTGFVQQVLECRSKFQGYVENSFGSDRSFVKALKSSLEHFINLDSRAAQYLSLYVDDMLKKKMKSDSEAEAELKLNAVISIYRYLHDKDVFEDFYKQHLAGRLLTGTSVNAELEKLMIAKLKAESGHQFTSKLEGMFKDIELSKQLMKQFQSIQGQKGAMTKSLSTLSSADGDDESNDSFLPSSTPLLTVSVLTVGFWPIQQSPDCILPPVAQQCLDQFRTFYTSVHSGRRLTWQLNLGTAELRCHFDAGRRELQVHTYQMCILMLFNQSEQYTYQQIQQMTSIPEAELQRHLLSLAHPQVKVLKKSPNTKAIANDHKFVYNRQYTSKLYKNKIPLLSKAALSGKEGETTTGGVSTIQGVETTSSQQSDSNVPPAVLEARKNRVEAAIVRIMKSRKTLDHNNLMAEVVKQLSSKFAAEPAFIKKRIESLIEREYIERDKENRKVYHYLA